MSRKYTAQEMREMALCVDRDVFSDGRGNYDANGFMGFDPDIISSMLRQAAEDLEREEKLERKYEYALVANGVTYNNHYCDFRSATLIRGFGEKVVRREVGEWEEFDDEAGKDC